MCGKLLLVFGWFDRREKIRRFLACRPFIRIFSWNLGECFGLANGTTAASAQADVEIIPKDRVQLLLRRKRSKFRNR